MVQHCISANAYTRYDTELQFVIDLSSYLSLKATHTVRWFETAVFICFFFRSLFFRYFRACMPRQSRLPTVWLTLLYRKPIYHFALRRTGRRSVCQYANASSQKYRPHDMGLELISCFGTGSCPRQAAWVSADRRTERSDFGNTSTKFSLYSSFPPICACSHLYESFSILPHYIFFV